MPQMSSLRDALAKAMQERNALLRVSDSVPQRNALLDAPRYRSMSEEELYRDWNPINELRSAINVGSIPKGNPQERETLANALLSVTPGPGNVMSANDALNSGRDAYDAFQAGDYKGGALASALTALSGAGAVFGLPFGKLAKGAAGAGKNALFSGAGLVDDETARMARAKQMGYADEPFYRGEATGKTYEGDAAFFSRDPEYAAGFAAKGGQNAPAEYRLNLTKTFTDAAPISAADYGRIVEAAAHRDPKLAADLAESIAPGKGVDWVIGFAKARPDFIVVERGGAPFVRHAIERGSSDAVGLFRAAGYDALDSGRDVQKIGAEGIRSKNARFDPSKASSTDIMAGLAGASLLPAWLLSQDER